MSFAARPLSAIRWQTFSLILLFSFFIKPVRGEEPGTSKRLTQLIDNCIAETWEENGLEPAPVINDAGFLRRVSLDLIGRVPTVAETREFLGSRDPDKREKLVDRLIASPEFDRHMATVLRRIWIPQLDTQQFARLIEDYESWLERRLRARTALDVLVRQQLIIPVNRMAVPINPEGDQLGSSAFVAASDLQPELLAANTSRAFLGINIDCAQCHDHPFARWTRNQFWEMAAFFARPHLQEGTSKRTLLIPVGDTAQTVTPALLTGNPVNWPEELTSNTGRELLADWITSQENPWFARNAVNRIWANFLGTGFVEPLDDLSGEIQPSHSKLFTMLSQEFTAGGFDLRLLVRSIILSRPYQLSSDLPQETGFDEPQTFARMPIRALTGEQLYSSLFTVAGFSQETPQPGNPYQRNKRGEFAGDFLVTRPNEGQRSLVQALNMMNGKLMSEVTGEDSPLLTAVSEAPFLSDAERIETLFLATLSRPPTEDELTVMREHLQNRSDIRQALADILWALLNSSEFNTNH